MTAKVFHAHLYGSRQAKYECLADDDVSKTEWTELNPSAPFCLFVPQDANLRAEYDQGWSVRDVFGENGDPAPGVVTTHDEFAIGFTPKDVISKVESLLETDTEDEARRKFRLCSQSQWNYATAKRELASASWRKRVVPILYRPFDIRATVFDRHVAVHRRERVMRHMLAGKNLALITARSNRSPEMDHFLCTAHISETKCGESTIQSYLIPLYLYPSEGPELRLEKERRPNLSSTFLKPLAEKLKLPQEEPQGLPRGVTPEHIFQYAYAVFHSPTYRTRYAEFLKIDFPRLPLTSNLHLFRTLAVKGAELVALHLMESPKVEDFLTDWRVKGDNVVGKVQYTEKDNRVWINKTQYFGGVPKKVWEFRIGGYQVCHKWLKDRKGRRLTYEDTQHYQKVVVALNETVRLMAEIDEAIGEHGGWPMR